MSKVKSIVMLLRLNRGFHPLPTSAFVEFLPRPPKKTHLHSSARDKPAAQAHLDTQDILKNKNETESLGGKLSYKH